MTSASAPLATDVVRLRLGLFAVAFAATVTLLVLAAAFLWPSTADGVAMQTFDAGVAASYEPGSIHRFEAQHLYLVRRSDSSFVALYDWDAWAQRRYQDGATEMAQCRVQTMPEDDLAYRGDLQSIRSKYTREQGIENVVLRSGCDGSSFDAIGRLGFGPAGADLDRFPVYIAPNGHVVVTLSQRTCQTWSPCLPYQ